MLVKLFCTEDDPRLMPGFDILIF